MRIIQAEQIAQAVCEMCVRASTRLPGDIKERIAFAEAHRALALGVRHTGLPRRKLETCRTDRPPICQDTGLVCVFLGMGIRRISTETSFVRATKVSGGDTGRVCANPWRVTRWAG